jgi:hypothetical protein
MRAAALFLHPYSSDSTLIKSPFFSLPVPGLPYSNLFTVLTPSIVSTRQIHSELRTLNAVIIFGDLNL